MKALLIHEQNNRFFAEHNKFSNLIAKFVREANKNQTNLA
tara:strand:+ start:927 stop:1046 length:120 start_codon:yes stop_codon:yes gene_type:complete